MCVLSVSGKLYKKANYFQYLFNKIKIVNAKGSISVSACVCSYDKSVNKIKIINATYSKAFVKSRA